MRVRVHDVVLTGPQLKQILEHHQINQRAFADAAGINQATVSRALTSSANTRYSTKMGIKQAAEHLIPASAVQQYQQSQAVAAGSQAAEPEEIKEAAPETSVFKGGLKIGQAAGFPIDEAHKFAVAAREAYKAESIDTTFSLRGLINMAQLYTLFSEKLSLKPEHALSGAFWLTAGNQSKGEVRKFMTEMFQSCFGFNCHPMEKVLKPIKAKSLSQHPLEPVLELLVEARWHTWNYGLKGCGKSRAIYEVAQRTHQGKMFRIQGTKDRTVDDLVGGRGARDGSTHYEYGPLPLAARLGYMLVVDEISALGSEVLFELHSVLEGNPLTLAKNRGEVVELHEDFVIVASDNTLGQGEDLSYVGTGMVNEALRDRFVFLEWDFMPKEREVAAVEQHVALFAGAGFKKVEPGTPAAKRIKPVDLVKESEAKDGTKFEEKPSNEAGYDWVTMNGEQWKIGEVLG